MISVECYKAFRGTMRISPVNGKPFTLFGDWLYKPEYDCWYCKGRSFVASRCTVVSEGWISVKDALPKEGVKVLCMGVKGGIHIGEYYSNGWYINGQNKPKISHWLPIPAKEA